ncbi:MAG: hypothetical protein IAG10_23315 [Planctomycetaceae bacterium]|nr:hypothetical protein [Planctomycetaceae bacterium]
MIRRLGLSILLVSLMVSLGSVAQESKVPTQPAEPKPETAAVSPIEESIAAELADRVRRDEAAAWLSKPTQVSFTDIPLGDAAKFLSDFHNARIRLDAAANGERLSFPDASVTLVTEKQPLSHVLNRLTQSAEAVWTIHRGDILITSPAREQELLETRVYRVGRLLRLSAARAVLPASTSPSQRSSAGGFGFSGRGFPSERTIDDLLTQFITESTSIPWQMTSGEGGTLSLLGDQLIVRQTYRGHEEVARLLRFAEVALTRAPGSPPLMLMSPEEATQLARLQKALRREIDLRLAQTLLVDVVPLLRDHLGEDVYIEHSEVTRPLNLGNKELTLAEGRYVAREALRQMLSPHNLTAVIDDGAICITPTERAQLRHLTVIYDVADLLRTSDDRDALQTSIQESTTGPWQELGGEGGTISNVLGGLLVIRQNEHVHTEIALLLQELRQARKDTAKEASAPKTTDFETRFHKAKTKDEAEALERLILTFVAPTTWDVSGGRGVLRTAEDRLIIQQTKAVHDQIDQFLREYQQAKPLGQTPAATK